ncbi:type II toxin-antitoxin system VapC family toxin [Microbacterium hydrocarbonoxydans]|uniref:type II toxin-antitoxin system VapC family toxin n=1 Tax=Microbacterium hydrocarbonoxydans TaxID=273678 RepID=UPI002042136F|nr:type II toxin-antitoxin system VapC family toxin [Microbacterium hydrocarbonoxydans]MCM3779597.1 type II toxin-antitoxin system VapC family toxin [Microbacterium hydrocarbonoxydans]
MSAYLLDTHVVLWLATDPERVPSTLRAQLTEAESVYVSAASPYEIAQKTRLGLLPHGGRVLTRWQPLMQLLFATELPLSAAHMRAAGELAWEHRDPFDRMLVAQAQLDGLILVTADERILAYPEVSCAEWM